jgi:hypothetical protein
MPDSQSGFSVYITLVKKDAHNEPFGPPLVGMATVCRRNGPNRFSGLLGLRRTRQLFSWHSVSSLRSGDRISRRHRNRALGQVDLERLGIESVKGIIPEKSLDKSCLVC